MAATINDTVVMFLVDTGSALTILRRDIWEKCKEPQQQLVPWCQSTLIGAEGSQLHVFGSAEVRLNIEGESLELFCGTQEKKLCNTRSRFNALGSVFATNTVIDDTAFPNLSTVVLHVYVPPMKGGFIVFDGVFV